MHMNMNSGLFYIKASPKTVAFMDRIAARLSREKAWDQARACPRPCGHSRVGSALAPMTDLLLMLQCWRPRAGEGAGEYHGECPATMERAA